MNKKKLIGSILLNMFTQALRSLFTILSMM